MTPELRARDVDEKKFWAYIRALLSCSHVHMQRIETTTGPGVPDVNMCCNGVECWVELKCETRYGVLLRPEQNVWLLRRAAHGGRAFVVARMRNNDVAIWKYSSTVRITYNIYADKYLQLSSLPNVAIPCKSKNILDTLITTLFTND